MCSQTYNMSWSSLRPLAVFDWRVCGTLPVRAMCGARADGALHEVGAESSGPFRGRCCFWCCSLPGGFEVIAWRGNVLSFSVKVVRLRLALASAGSQRGYWPRSSFSCHSGSRRLPMFYVPICGLMQHRQFFSTMQQKPPFIEKCFYFSIRAWTTCSIGCWTQTGHTLSMRVKYPSPCGTTVFRCVSVLPRGRTCLHGVCLHGVGAFRMLLHAVCIVPN